MSEMMVSLMVFLVSVLLHLGLCRTVLPARMPLRMAALVPLTLLGGMVYLGTVFGLSGGASLRLPLSGGVVYLLLMMTYFVFFGNAALESPTQAVVIYLRQRRQATMDDLLREVNDERFIMTRLDSLVRNGLAVEEEGHYRLAAKGRALAGWLDIYARVLGRKTGG